MEAEPGPTVDGLKPNSNEKVAWLLLLLATLGVWTVGLACWLLLFWLQSEGLACEYRGSSIYGEPGWSVLPPGPTCTWTEEVHGFDRASGPGPWMSIWLLVATVFAFVLWRWGRKLFSTR